MKQFKKTGRMLAGALPLLSAAQRQGTHRLARGLSGSIPTGIRMLEWPCQEEKP